MLLLNTILALCTMCCFSCKFCGSLYDRTFQQYACGPSYGELAPCVVRAQQL